METRKVFKGQVRMAMLIFIPVVALMFTTMQGCGQKGGGDETTAETMPPPPPPPAPAPPPPPQESQTAGADTYTEVDQMPEFEGGDKGLLNYLKENTRYPESSKLSGTQGKVLIRFAVEADGTVGRASVLKGADPDLDQEALRVVSSLPAFEPGRKDGKAVAVWYTIPIEFKLQ
ncbi:MAG: energy transducer TonB [Bacteroidales bacterium]|nr:energy transducer TonB [Bacteroidales bacterium]